MRSGVWRRAERVLSVAWLIALLLGYGAFGLSVVLLGLAALVAYGLGRRWVPSWRRAWQQAHPNEALEVVLSTPGPRYHDREPVQVATLARLLADSNLGAISLEAGRLKVAAGRDFVCFEAARDPVARGDLKVSATSVELAVLACEALATRLGPMQVDAGGISIVVDGTRPRLELEREVHSLKIDRLSRLRSGLDAPPSRQLPS
nr:hypothetical protein Hi04_10k_c3807_00007 [uncultured bacterium]